MYRYPLLLAFLLARTLGHVLFLFLTAPVAAHLIARAAYAKPY